MRAMMGGVSKNLLSGNHPAMPLGFGTDGGRSGAALYVSSPGGTRIPGAGAGPTAAAPPPLLPPVASGKGEPVPVPSAGNVCMFPPAEAARDSRLSSMFLSIKIFSMIRFFLRSSEPLAFFLSVCVRSLALCALDPLAACVLVLGMGGLFVVDMLLDELPPLVAFFLVFVLRKVSVPTASVIRTASAATVMARTKPLLLIRVGAQRQRRISANFRFHE